MEIEHALLLSRYHRIEGQVGQFDLKTPDGRREMCEFYEERNTRYQHPAFERPEQIQQFRQVAELYINSGIEGLTGLLQTPENP